MNKATQGVLLIVIGAVALRLVWTGTYLDYVKDRMIGPLVVTGVILFLLGVATSVQAARARAQEDGASDVQDEGHHEHHGPAVGWLLVLPLVAILLVAPRALGADAASRQAEAIVVVADEFPPLRELVDGYRPIDVGQLLARVHYDETGAVAGEPVRVTGFVAHDPERVPDGFLVSRFSISCCAADAQVVQVAVPGQEAPPEDTWVEVEGVVLDDPALDGTSQGGTLPLVSLVADRVTEVEAPRNPYE